MGGALRPRLTFLHIARYKWHYLLFFLNMLHIYKEVLLLRGMCWWKNEERAEEGAAAAPSNNEASKKKNKEVGIGRVE